jgi:glutaminyl-tRNA synthetase
VKHALKAKVNIYDHLFSAENPDDTAEGVDFTDTINPNSLKVLEGCFVEQSVKDAAPLDRFQFERLGYFCVDKGSTPETIVFNRTVTLKDTWAKIQKK